MKICLINNLYKPYNRGGTDKVVENIVNGLKTAGHDVFVISTRPIFGIRNSEFGIRNYYISSTFPYLNKIPKPIRLLWHFWDCFNFINYFKIKAILKKEKPEIVMTHNLKGLGFLVPALLRKLKIKHIHYLHDIQLLHPSGLIFFQQEKKLDSLSAKIYAQTCSRLFKSPNIVISPSRWLLETYKKRNFFEKSKKEVLFNPAILSETEREEKKSDKFRFLYVGEIERHKGAPFLLEAFWEIKTPENELVIIGRGNCLEDLKNKTKNEPNIKILGWQNHQEVKKNMAQAQALVMPSTCYENSPTVIYEAVSLGLPFIASELGGASELAKKFNGILFSPADKEDLKRKMLHVMQNYSEIKKASQLGRQKIEEISLEKYIQKLLQIIA